MTRSPCDRSSAMDGTKNPLSHVFQNMKLHGDKEGTAFKWRVLAGQTDYHSRLATEALFIREAGARKKNGCEVAQLTPQLA